jgi:arylsulfatase A-like enzyme
MNRREFLKTGAAVAIATTNSMEAKTKLKAKTRKPNVLFVFSDQHRAFSLPGEPFNQAIAPNIDAFREANCSMEQCVSNYPLCSPYRGILISGMYPQESGQMGNEDILNPNVGPLGETFRNAGYHTGYVGKWHIHGQRSIGREDVDFIPKGPYRMGFDDWRVWADTNDHYHCWTFNQETGEKETFPEGWQPVNMTNQAIDFMKAQPKDKPWMLVLSWNPPHPRFDPPQEDRVPYPLDQIKFRPNVNIENGADKHKGVRSDSGLRDSAQGYMGGITAIDKEFARVLQGLEESGHAEDTIIVYTSDHGEMMGSQGLMGKRVPYEESCRVPFAVRYPGVTLKKHKSDTLFSAVDIYPTLCGLAGVPVPKHCSGRDLSDAMRGRKIEEPKYVFMISEPEKPGAHAVAMAILDGKDAQAAAAAAPAPKRNNRKATKPDAGANGEAAGKGEDGGCPPYRGVRTKTHTYIVADTGRWLLYENIADPYQMKNLAADESQKTLMESLDVEVEKWLHSVNDTFPYATAKTKVYGVS